MAERRMFAKSIINSARFLMMPATARLLYYDLGMFADDDGIVEAFSVLRTTNLDESDLQILAEKGFIKILNDELVAYITTWKQNNLIRKDRYTPSMYAHLLEGITDGIPTVNQRLTQDSVVEDSVVEDSIDKSYKGEKVDNENNGDKEIKGIFSDEKTSPPERIIHIPSLDPPMTEEEEETYSTMIQTGLTPEAALRLINRLRKGDSNNDA